MVINYHISTYCEKFSLLGLSFTSCVSLYRRRRLDMVLWLTVTPKNTATSCCFHPASKWPMALARSTLDNFTIFTVTDQHVKVSFNPLQFDSVWVTIQFIDDQSCLWVVVHYWQGEILPNFCWTPPLFSGPYLSLLSWYWDIISCIWMGMDKTIKWYNQLIYKPINPPPPPPRPL